MQAFTEIREDKQELGGMDASPGRINVLQDTISPFLSRLLPQVQQQTDPAWVSQLRRLLILTGTVSFIREWLFYTRLYRVGRDLVIDKS